MGFNKEKFEKEGSLVVERIYTNEEVLELKTKLSYFLKEEENRIIATRNLLLKHPSLKDTLFNKKIKKLVSKIDKKAFLTKAIFFDKPEEGNWYVTWHQDMTIHVNSKVDLPNFNGWTRKNTTYHVCPPKHLLEENFTLRIHLDDTTESNGALKIITATHKNKLSDGEINRTVMNNDFNYVSVPSGGVQIMRPLLLHASSKSTNGKRRRVIHLEFSSKRLPSGLEWQEYEEVL